MPVTRRVLLTIVAASAALPIGPIAADAAVAAVDTHAERGIGNADAKIKVEEFFSLTCIHCARFAQETFPQVKSKLIDTGKVRWVFRDFPLDQLALTAAMVAHYLPPNRYEPFVLALLSSQDQWAFARDINHDNELWKYAALAGMSKATFNTAIHDTALRNWILQQQDAAQKRWGIDSTPSFVINGKEYSGEMGYDTFVKLLPSV